MDKQLKPQKVSFAGAVKIAFKKYFDFRGVAERREYWFFVLFTILVSVVLGTIDQILTPPSTVAADAFALSLEQNPTSLNFELLNAALAESANATPISNFAGLLTLLPLFTAMVRRMRDAGFGAWWLLLSWVPLFTLIVTLLPTKQKPEPGSVPEGIRIDS